MHQETWRLCAQLTTKAAHEVVDGVVAHVPEDRAVGERDVVVVVESVRHVRRHVRHVLAAVNLLSVSRMP